MSRGVGTDLAAMLASNAHKLATMLRMDLANGDVVAFTDHDATLNYDLGDGAIDYLPWSGISPSDVVLTVGFDASNFEVTGPLGSDVTRDQVLGGRFRNAVARLFYVNWADLTEGSINLMKGKIASPRVEGSKFIFEVRNAMDAFNQSQGRVLSPYCSAVFGDPSTGCPVVRTAYPGTVTAVTDPLRFTVDVAEADDFFDLGTVAFLTGDLSGTAEAKLFSYADTGAVEMYEPLIAVPAIGDTFNLYRGCSKLLKSDDVSVPTCFTYSAVESFRGWPEVPGSRFYHKVSAPGTAYA